MRSIILLFISTLLPLFAIAQVYQTEVGRVRFFSSAPLEDIEATTVKAKGILNSTTQQVAVLIPIKSFVFDKALMQEHFNDNYMESDKFPNATFEGTITEKLNTQNTGEQIVNVSGHLKIHGISVERNIPVRIRNENGSIKAFSKFNIKLEDHKIKIPQLVFQNIAESVEVTLELNLNIISK